jgi:inosine-uridine nucleoside N-ribohydrolase
MMAKQIILDCDPGNDDALGIIVALGSDNLSLQAVTTGAGHLANDRTFKNACITIAQIGTLNIPVSKGAENPLVRDRLIAKVLDLTSGLDSDRDDLNSIEPDSRNSVQLMHDIIIDNPGITIVTTGPLTNLAMLFNLHPKLKNSIERIFSLAGSIGLGNKTASSEWNILCDPEAASAVFNSGVPITLIPIDTSLDVGISDALIKDVKTISTPISKFVVELLTSLVSTFSPSILGPKLMPLNDPIATLIAAEPDLVTTEKARLDVELSGNYTYGRTVVDFLFRDGKEANADIAISINTKQLENAFLNSITNLNN